MLNVLGLVQLGGDVIMMIAYAWSGVVGQRMTPFFRIAKVGETDSNTYWNVKAFHFVS